MVLSLSGVFGVSAIIEGYGESSDFIAWYPDRGDSRPDPLLNESLLDTQAFLNMGRKARRE